MITVYIKKIINIPEAEKQNIITALSSHALERLNKKRNEELFLASLCALSLLTDEQRSNLNYTANGRPFFANINADISISHSQTHAAVAISNSSSIPVGVDIEDNSNAQVSLRFFTKNEKKHLKHSNKPCPHLTRGVSTKLTGGEKKITLDVQSFLEIWTKKEALFKYLKDDSTPFINLDSTTPEKYGANFTTIKIDNSTLTICTNENEKIEIIEK